MQTSRSREDAVFSCSRRFICLSGLVLLGWINLSAIPLDGAAVSTISYHQTGSANGATGNGPFSFDKTDLKQFIHTPGTDDQPLEFDAQFTAAQNGPGVNMSNVLSEAKSFSQIGGLGVSYLAVASVNHDATAGTVRTANVSGIVEARFQDVITFHSPVPGRKARLTSLFNLSGALSASMTGDSDGGKNYGGADAILDISAHITDSLDTVRSIIPPDPYPGGYYGRCKDTLDPAVADINDPAPKIISINILANDGEQLRLDVSLMLTCAGGAGNSPAGARAGGAGAFIDADFIHTLAWGGITSVTDDETGQPVTGWTITSESGFNYANPVPEPCIMPAIAGALFLLGGRKTKRRRDPMARI